MFEISQSEWQAYVDEHKEHGKSLHTLNVAVFGDPDHPETATYAIKPTMARINAFVDVWKWIGTCFIAAGVTAPFWLPLLKWVLRELAK